MKINEPVFVRVRVSERWRDRRTAKDSAQAPLAPLLVIEVQVPSEV